MKLKALLGKCPIIPVLTLHKTEHAVPLAEALLAGGLNTLEITLRTPAALEAIQAIHQALPECILAAGTITTPPQLAAAKAAGVKFAVSPGLTAPLLNAAKAIDLPLLAGVTTPSEALLALEHDCDVVKFFPAELSGGIPKLKTFASVFPGLQFCPTGGVNPDNLANYLSQPNVISVGGTWLGPQHLIEKQDWAGITQLAKEAAEIA